MKRRGLVSKGTVMRMRQAARAAWEIRDWQQCMDYLDRARRLAPTDVGILIQMGRVCGMRHDYAAAERNFEIALRLAAPAKKAQTLAEIGQQARDFYSRDLAKRYLERAVEEQANPDTLTRLAEVCERLRQNDRASELIEQALNMDSAFFPAQLGRARLAHRAGRLEEAEERLRPLLALAVPQEVRVRAGYELGAVLDRQGRYDEAMAAFVAAKALLHHAAKPQFTHLQAARKHHAQMREQVTQEILHKWREFGRELQPQRRLTLLGGHPRSGTTLLEQVLDSHPHVASAEETNNFADYTYLPQKRGFPEDAPLLHVLNCATKDQITSYRKNYIQASELCVGESLDARLLIDKNPSFTFLIPAFVRFFPETRFLIAIRDPRDVCLSCFMQAFVPIQEVSSAWLRLETTAHEYAALMNTWLTLKPLLQNPWLEIRYEDMVDDLEPVARKTLEFLEVPWDERVLGFDEHARKKIVRSPTYSDVTQKVFTRARGRWRNYQKYLEPHLHILEPFVKAFGYE